MRLGELLSSVFEMSWDVKNLEDSHQAFDHAITWGPFPTYMELYCKNYCFIRNSYLEYPRMLSDVGQIMTLLHNAFI